MGVFRLNPAGLDPEALELELIDHGLEEMGESTGEKGEPQLVIRCAFTDFGQLQKALEDRGITPLSAESEYVPADARSSSPRTRPPRCSSWSTRWSRTTTCRRSSTTSARYPETPHSRPRTGG